MSIIPFVVEEYLYSLRRKKKDVIVEIKVWGNCEKCKKTIEGAVNMDGVVEKNWSPESTLMTVKFDTTKVSIDKIQKAIALAGYDNDKYYGDDYAYGKLEACCQYERKPFELK